VSTATPAALAIEGYVRQAQSSAKPTIHRTLLLAWTTPDRVKVTHRI
jgi:hypothetical protein